jgi:hypothetical protein
MHLLKTVLEHGAVTFFEQIFVDVNSVVRINSEEVVDVGGVVDLAHAQAVCYDRSAEFVGVGKYVCGVEKFRVVESADSAFVRVGEEHFAAEFALVDSVLDHAFDVLA